MLKKFRDKVAFSGITVLGIGVALLVFTFISAYGFLTQSLSIIASEDLVRTFGEALAPLIATCIRIMYLGVMGWIGSLLTMRGVAIIANAPKIEAIVPQKPAVIQQKTLPKRGEAEPQKETKPEAKPSEPEFVVIPPEQAAPQQKNDSPQPQSNS
jgi:hypothetical protein